MIFFIIAASVMSLLIVLIHRLARHFGCELPLSSLVLCGLCAIVINFVIISVTPFLTKSYYYNAGAMITFAAFGTTCYNKYWLHRKLRLAGSAQLDAMPQEQDETGMVSGTLPEAQEEPDEATIRTEEPDGATIRTEESDGATIHTEEPDAATAGTETNSAVTAAVEMTVSADAADAADTDTDTHTTTAADEAAGTETVADDRTAKDDIATLDSTDTDGAAADDKLAATLAAMTTMDQLLDFAFEHTLQKEHPVALAAYTEALARYREDSYAPFIVVSITNIYKELGDYQAAIDSIQSAMNLPALTENESIRKQFEDTRLYLTATKNVLHGAGLGSISFKDIPKKYMSKIESIYNSRKSR